MKTTLSENIEHYRELIELETIPNAYKELMEYLMHLRNQFINNYPEEFIVGSFYQGYMDFSYIPITNDRLRTHKLKIVLIFNHKGFQFEVWLVGQNKKIQKQYWELLRDHKSKKYLISDDPKRSIIEHTLIDQPNFNKLKSLTKKIQQETKEFMNEIVEVIENKR